MTSGYEQTYRAVVSRLKSCDFPLAARRLGLELRGPELLGADFLGRKYLISPEEVRPLDGGGGAAHPNILSVLVYYASSRGSIPLGEDYRLLQSFAGPLFSGGGSSSQWLCAPLARRCAADYPGFCRAALALGMRESGNAKRGEHIWDYHILPQIPLRLVCFEADEEFPWEAKLYYDKSVSDYLDFEPLAVLSGCFAGALSKRA